MRELYFSDEFWSFYNLQPDRIKTKFDFILNIVRTEKIVTTKFVKHLVGTDLYEMRVSIGNNEYRTILFAINHDNIINATKIFVLNAFLKKTSKDYQKQINIALRILGGKGYDEV